jgi:hypothetical protein
MKTSAEMFGWQSASWADGHTSRIGPARSSLPLEMGVEGKA